MSQIRTFITKNKLNFNEGSRNSTVTTLIGYGQYLGLTKNKLKAELVEEMDEDEFISEEIDRLWDYCASNGYKNYWSSPTVKKSYKF